MESNRIEQLAQRLVADMEITRSMGREISPDGSYSGCALCLWGAVLVAANEEFPGLITRRVTALLDITSRQANSLEAGFCWPQHGMVSWDEPDFFALGKRLREDVLAQRTIHEASTDASVVAS